MSHYLGLDEGKVLGSLAKYHTKQGLWEGDGIWQGGGVIGDTFISFNIHVFCYSMKESIKGLLVSQK